MSSAPIVDRIRIIPRPADFLDRNVGASGEVFFNRATNSLRVYSGKDRSGFEIARADLSNISDTVLETRINELGISGTDDAASVDVSETVPEEPANGNLWLNTANGRLYIYVNDGDSSQWIQPAVPAFSGNYDDLTNKPIIPLDTQELTNSAGYATETYVDDAIAAIPETDLTGYATETYVNQSVANLVNSAPETLDTLNELAAALGNDADFATTVTESISDKAPIDNPSFTGTATFASTSETLNTINAATGTVVHDFSQGAIWYHDAPAADFTANFTNVPTINNRAISVALILEQGATARIPNAVEIDGASQTINWTDASVPTGNADQVDLVSFSFIRTGSTWTVLGSLSTYG